MVGTKCGHCHKVTNAGFVCASCRDALTAALKNVPEMIDQLRLALSRQTRFTVDGGGRSTASAPVPFNPVASDTSLMYARTILTWQANLADHMNPPRGPKHTPVPYRVSEPVRFLNPIAAAAWCWHAIDQRGIASWVSAPKMVGDILAAEAKAEKAIDRPLPHEYLGDCTLTDDVGEPCEGRVYAEPDEVYGVCSVCKGRCDADEQRLKLLVWLDERTLTAAEIARTSTYLGLTINREQVRKRINQWHKRKRITAVSIVTTTATLGEEIDPEMADEESTAPVFRFGDVRLLLEAEEEARDRRERARAKVSDRG